ncbi:MAG: ferrous iron transporter B [Candidatus Altiarchaeota archaeon]|nr:ferrous iron transporter B [Candidatus Altiarchaeota archaeon]
MKSKLFRAGLLGNPNVGKSTIFNVITGRRQHVGNWPGKTVDVSWAKVKYQNKLFEITDLPGTYSISGKDDAEKVTEEYISTKPDALLVVVDASSLHKGLYPLIQVMEKGHRVGLIVNMMDEINEDSIDLKKLEKNLKIPVLGLSKNKDKGEILKFLNSTKTVKINNKNPKGRHNLIALLLKGVVKSEARKDGMDKHLFSPLFDLALILLTSLALLAPPFYVATWMNDFVASIVPLTNPISASIYTIFFFLVLIFLFFTTFTLIEDSGLLARAAASTDKYLPLPGKAFFPIVISFGCNVVGVTGTRVIPDKVYKRAVALAVPFVQCGTRIAILLLFLSFFPALTAALLGTYIFLAMLLAVVITILVFARGYKKPPLLMELPKIRTPSLKTAISFTYIRTKVFFTKVGPWIILGAFVGELIQLLNLGGNLVFNTILALLLGFFAKELTAGIMLGVFGTLNVLTLFGPSWASAFIVFYALYTPCISTLAAIKSEFGTKDALISAVWSSFVAMCFALVPLLLT